MKYIKLMVIAILGMVITMTSCTKNTHITYEIENVTVQLNSKELLSVVQKQMGSKAKATRASTSSTSTSATDDYEHVFPTGYKAYFVSKEAKGEYTVGQVVKVIDVTAGSNTITIPKLNYEVYVTNYVENDGTENKPYAWYKTTGISVLPAHSNQLYLFGKGDIDYSKVTEGTVELTNPYAAVMIRKNQWVGVPTYNYGDPHPAYTLTPSGVWYLLYIKGNNTQTTIPITIPGYNSGNYQLNRPIEGNKEYRFTIDGSVEQLTNGGFFVDVNPIEKTVEETIKL